MDGSEDTLLKLQEKHPSIHPDRQLLLAPEDDDGGISPIITREDVRVAIKSFRNGSGGGPDELLPQHLKDMTGTLLGDADINHLDTITDFLNKVFVSGQVPDLLWCQIDSTI